MNIFDLGANKSNADQLGCDLISIVSISIPKGCIVTVHTVKNVKQETKGPRSREGAISDMMVRYAGVISPKASPAIILPIRNITRLLSRLAG